MPQTLHDMEQRLAELIRSAKVTHLHEIDPDTPLDALGLDSLAAMILIDKMETDLGLSIEPTDLWDHATVSALARHLLDQRESAVPVHKQPVLDADSA